MSNDPYVIQNDIPIPDRETYVPGFTGPFSDLDLMAPVTLNGQRLGFQIRDVLPERRFAIQSGEKLGELYPQEEFQKRYVQWISRGCAADGTIVNLSQVNEYFTPDLEPVPKVERFVDRKLDYGGKGVPINWDPKPQKAVKTEAYTSDGEESRTDSALPVGFDAIAPPSEAEAAPVESSPEAPPVTHSCNECGKEARSAAGLAAHQRHAHPKE